MQHLFRIIWLLISLLFLQACSSLGQHKETQTNNEIIKRRTLVRSTYQSPAYFVVFAAADAKEKNKLKMVLEEYIKNTDRNNIQLIDENELQATQLNTTPLLFIGAHQNIQTFKDFGDKIPLTSHHQNFSFNNKIYKDSADVFLLSYFPNPINRQLPISFITGNTHQAVVTFLKQAQGLFNFGRWGFEHYQNNQRRLMGNFDDNLPEWRINPASIFEFQEPEQSHTDLTGVQFKIHDASIPQKKIQSIARELKKNQAHFKQLFQIDSLPVINYEIFLDGEQKGLTTGNTLPAHKNIRTQTAFIAISQDQNGIEYHPEISLFAQSVLGKTPFPLLEAGLPIYFSSQWQKKGYLYWFSQLAKTNNDFTVKKLLSEEGLAEPSSLVTQTVAGAFSHFLIEEQGIEKFKTIYQGNISPKEIETLDKAWKSWQSQLTYSSQAWQDLPEKFYWKGFNFTHEGYQIYNGYLSKQAQGSLDRLKSLGSNAITLVPYSYMRDPKKPSAFPIPQSAGSENDASIIHSIYHAHQKGLKVLLKPQVWVGRNSWPGDVEMQSEEDWEVFFENYYRWIRHYALMASIHHVEALCLGVEFSKATMQHPEKWEEIITEIRKLYKGPITYSANWGEEFEKLAFWDKLDYIGISCYYPLTKDKQPSDKQLIKGFEDNMDKLEKVAKKHNKPLLLTEIGFRSITAPWIQPHDYPGEQTASEYKVVFGCLQNESWCRGMFWWKWPTTFDRTDPNNRLFTPYNKAAEKTVKKWYSKI